MPSITSRDFGDTPHGPAQLFTLTNDRGDHVKITNYGGIITSISVAATELVLGYDTLAPYLEDHPYFGALIGRYGNRIAHGKFTLDGETYHLPINNGEHTLHGGTDTFDKQLWTAATVSEEDEVALVLTHVSPAGDQGFPGELTVECRYGWSNAGELSLRYRATTTRDTVVNLTNHSYFTLGAAPTIEPLVLELTAPRYVPVDAGSIPLGHLEDVSGTPFDFRTAKPLGRDLRDDNPQLKIANGYDHTLVLPPAAGAPRRFATLTNPENGIRMVSLTTEPGVQLFTANFDPGQFTRRDGSPLPRYAAVCLETQHYPDSPNRPEFPSTRLNVGEVYNTTTVYRFERG